MHEPTFDEYRFTFRFHFTQIDYVTPFRSRQTCRVLLLPMSVTVCRRVSLCISRLARIRPMSTYYHASKLRSLMCMLPITDVVSSFSGGVAIRCCRL